jgi:putative addiction module component (TIGR02574 family)
MSIEQIAAEALRLPADERARLAESLWESLEGPFKAPGAMDDAAALDLALDRDQQIEKGKVKAVSHEEMMARLRR